MADVQRLKRLEPACDRIQYDPDKLVNLCNNRWFVKLDFGISKAWRPLMLELCIIGKEV